MEQRSLGKLEGGKGFHLEDTRDKDVRVDPVPILDALDRFDLVAGLVLFGKTLVVSLLLETRFLLVVNFNVLEAHLGSEFAKTCKGHFFHKVFGKAFCLEQRYKSLVDQKFRQRQVVSLLLTHVVQNVALLERCKGSDGPSFVGREQQLPDLRRVQEVLRVASSCKHDLLERVDETNFASIFPPS